MFQEALDLGAKARAASARHSTGRRLLKRVIGVALVTACLLTVPLVAMHFTDEVNWDLADFVVAGVLLMSAGLAYTLVAGRMGNAAYRAGVGVAVAAALLLVWTNLAVGLIGSEDNPANLMYLGVLAVAIAGAASARLRPQGMARAMFATAFALALVALIAFGYLSREPLEALGVNGFFAALFVASAWLFRRAARAQPR
jgi:hypothetical protein